MLFTVLLLLCMTCTTGMPVRGYMRTASAVIYEEDGVWGSIVFQQLSKDSPVLIKASFKDVLQNNVSKVGYEIRSEPVHYDRYSRDKQCSNEALKGVLSTSGKEIGDLVRQTRMKHMSGHEFSQMLYDDEISLFEDSDKYIVGRSFVVRQGDEEGKFACGTIVPVARDDMTAGVIPCVKKVYEKCLVGTENPSLCVYQQCEGFERFWGSVDHTTMLCRVVKEVFPKASGGGAGGKVGCTHGEHSLLIPMQ